MVTVSTYVPVKELDYLMARISSGPVTFRRTVRPIGPATIDEIVAAMRKDREFRCPLFNRGTLTGLVRGNFVMLAKYRTDWGGSTADGKIESMMAMYDDDTVGDIKL